MRHTTGILCAPLTRQRAQQLRLPLMVPHGESPTRRKPLHPGGGWPIGTGVGAEDRSGTFRQLASQTATGDDFRRPGHVFPLAAREGGVLERAGHTEAAVDLCSLAAVEPPVGLVGELVNSADGSM